MERKLFDFSSVLFEWKEEGDKKEGEERGEGENKISNSQGGRIFGI